MSAFPSTNERDSLQENAGNGFHQTRRPFLPKFSRAQLNDSAKKKNYTNTNFELVSSTTLVPSKSEHGCLTESRGCLSDQVRKKKRLAEFEHNARTFSSY